MPILKCPDCSKEYNLDITSSGKTGKCNNCGTKFVVNFQEKDIDNQSPETIEVSQNDIKKKVAPNDIENNLLKVNEKISIKKIIIQTIKSPVILLNSLFILYIILLILIHNIGDLFLTIFSGIIIPIINIIYIKIHKNNDTKFQIFLSFLTITLNLFLLGLLFYFLDNNGMPSQLDEIFESVIIFLIPVFSLFTLYKEDGIKTKILKFFKGIFILLFTGGIILFISIYISSLSSYKESDFNIQKNAFDTKFGDRDPYSEDNGFNDLVEFIDTLDKRDDLRYFDILSKCVFDEEYIKNGNCEKAKQSYINEQKKHFKSEILLKMKHDLEENKISSDKYQQYRKTFYEKLNFTSIDIEKYPQLEKYINFEKYFQDNSEQFFDNYKHFVHIMNIKSKRLQSKDYILELPEYSFGYDGEKNFGAGKTISYVPLIQNIRGQRYVVYKYFESGDYNEGIKLLLEHQEFIDNLTNKTDASLINTLVNFTLSKTNLETLDYILLNYELSEDQKNRIIISLENKIDEGLIQNSLKREHINYRTIFQYLHDSSFISNVDYIGEKEPYIANLIQMLEGYLFFSVKESELISDKYAYEHIYNHKEWSCSININNYVGRNIACNLTTTYDKQYQKEQELIDLRKKILEEVKKPQ